MRLDDYGGCGQIEGFRGYAQGIAKQLITHNEAVGEAGGERLVD